MPAGNASRGWWGRHGGIVAFALASLALASGALVLLLKSHSSPSIEVVLPPATPAQQWQVYVSGAVATPGVYTLPGDATLEGSLQAAGGPIQGVERPRVQVYVPFEGVASDSLSGGSSPAAPLLPTFPPAQAKVDINTASAQELADRLTGIGPTLAKRIVQYREAYGPFERTEDIVDVPGIGPGIFEKIRDSISVGP